MGENKRTKSQKKIVLHPQRPTFEQSEGRNKMFETHKTEPGRMFICFVWANLVLLGPSRV